jgi:cysteinyl-tRNA synthetase
MVNIGQEKMSKSLGNFMTVKKAAEEVGGEALRLFVLGTHYRGPLDYSEERLGESKRALDRLYDSLLRADERLAGREAPMSATRRDAIVQQFRVGMDDDFNSARALAVLFDTMRALNRHVDAEEWSDAAACRKAIDDIGSVLGLARQEPRSYFEHQKREHLEDAEIAPAEVEKLIEQRKQAREARDFKRADEIRKDLKVRGIVLEDTPRGTVWKVER